MNSVTYILYTEKLDYCILIDCGEWETLQRVINKIGKTIDTVFLTHGHSDHISGLKELLRRFPNAKVASTIDGHEEIQDSRKNLFIMALHLRLKIISK